MKPAIVGLGETPRTRRYTASTIELAAAAVRAALVDAELPARAVDGLVVIRSPLAPLDEITIELQSFCGFPELRFSVLPEAEGASTIIGIQLAYLAVQAKMAQNVVVVFSDTPLKPKTTGASAFNAALPLSLIPNWESDLGLLGPAGAFALVARRYMNLYGATEDQLAAVALADRAWAAIHPDAMLKTPLTRAQYDASPFVVEPFHVLDCAYPVNGAAAFVVSTAERPRAVHIHGFGQGHNPRLLARDHEPELETGGAVAARAAYEMARIHPKDIRSRQFYEAFSVAQWIALEDYGFCKRGEAAAFVASGATAPGGAYPTNTNGGHLSGYYLQGATPVIEAIHQARTDRGAVLAQNFGGCFIHHSCLVLSGHEIL